LVRLLRALDEGVELDETIGPAIRGEVLCSRVCGGELGGKVGEVCEGEFAGVRAVAYADEAEVVLDEVAFGCRSASAFESRDSTMSVLVCVASAFYAGLGLGIAVQAA
jgi:hypothetical protein